MKPVKQNKIKKLNLFRPLLDIKKKNFNKNFKKYF